MMCRVSLSFVCIRNIAVPSLSLHIPSWGTFWPATEKLLGTNTDLISPELSMSITNKNYIILVNCSSVSQKFPDNKQPAA